MAKSIIHAKSRLWNSGVSKSSSILKLVSIFIFSINNWLKGKVILIFISKTYVLREALFIKRNRSRWKQIQDNPSTYPDEMAQEFIQLVEDLGYSKTFYPVSKTTLYLNGIASKKYLDIYQNKKERSNHIIAFFKYTLPLIIAKHHRVLLIS